MLQRSEAAGRLSRHIEGDVNAQTTALKARHVLGAYTTLSHRTTPWKNARGVSKEQTSISKWSFIREGLGLKCMAASIAGVNMDLTGTKCDLLDKDR